MLRRREIADVHTQRSAEPVADPAKPAEHAAAVGWVRARRTGRICAVGRHKMRLADLHRRCALRDLDGAEVRTADSRFASAFTGRLTLRSSSSVRRWYGFATHVTPPHSHER